MVTGIIVVLVLVLVLGLPKAGLKAGLSAGQSRLVELADRAGWSSWLVDLAGRESPKESKATVKRGRE